MRLLTAVLLLSLVACANTDKVEENLGPSELVDFDQEVSLKPLWEHQVGAGLGNAYARIKPVFDSESILIADAFGLVQSISIKNGRVNWQENFETEITAGVASSQGKGFIADANGFVIAFDVKNGEELWRSDIKSEVLAVPTADGDRLVVQTIDGKLHLLDANSGKINWSFDSNLPSLSLRGTSQAVFYQQQVIAGFANGKVVGLSATDGSIQWSERIGIPAGRSELERLVDVDGRLLISDSTLFVSGYQGHIAAIDLRAGKLLWKREASSYHGPLHGLGNLYLVSQDDRIFAIDEQSTSDVWVQAELAGRQLGEAQFIGGYIAVADYAGYLHLIKQLDGDIVGRAHLLRPTTDWVKTGSYGLKHPSRYFAQKAGIRTGLVVQGSYLLAMNDSGYLTLFELKDETRP